MSILNKFIEKYKIPIIIDDNEMIWYRALNICTLLDYKDKKCTIKKCVHTKYKKKFDELKHHLIKPIIKDHPNTIYMNTLGLKKLIISCRLPQAREIAKMIGIHENQKIIFKEACVIEQLDSFCKTSKIKYIHQFKINDRFRADYYLPEYNIIIEIDELNHKDRSKEYEEYRENKIKKLLNAIIIRYNPDSNKDNLGTLFGELFIEIQKIKLKKQNKKDKK